MANREDKLKDIMKKNPKLLDSMISCPEPSKLVILLEKYGIEITEIEASKILRALNFYDITSDIDGENNGRPPRKLDDKDLENTSGGFFGEIAFGYEVYKVVRNILHEEKKYHEERK